MSAFGRKHRARLPFAARAMIAALAGFAVGPFAIGSPALAQSTVSSQAPAPLREQAPLVAVTESRAKRRRRRESTYRYSDPMSHLRRMIESAVGRLSGRQWTRVRRFMYRANRIPRDAAGAMPAGAIIAKRCQPTFRVSATDLVLMGVHPKGIVFVTAGRHAFGVPWAWLKEAA